MDTRSQQEGTAQRGEIKDVQISGKGLPFMWVRQGQRKMTNDFREQYSFWNEERDHAFHPDMLMLRLEVSCV